jgi:hypothetical protein
MIKKNMEGKSNGLIVMPACLEVRKKSANIFNQDDRSPDRDLKPGQPRTEVT